MMERRSPVPHQPHRPQTPTQNQQRDATQTQTSVPCQQVNQALPTAQNALPRDEREDDEKVRCTQKARKYSFCYCLFVVFIIGALVGASIFTIYFLFYSKNTDKECNNFYATVCPDEGPRSSGRRHLGDLFESHNPETVKNFFKLSLVEAYFRDKNMIEILNTTDRFKKACEDTEKRKELGVKPLKNFLATIGDVSEEKWAAEKWDMESLFSMLGTISAKVDSNGLFNVFLTRNFFGNGEPIFVVSTVMDLIDTTTPFIHPRKFRRIRGEQMEDFVKTLLKIHTSIHGTNAKNIAAVHERITSVANFWRAISILKDRPHGKEMKLYTIAQLTTESGINWLPFFKEFAKPSANKKIEEALETGNCTMLASTKIIVHEPDMIRRTCKLIQVTCGGPKTVANYVSFQVIRPLLSHLNPQMESLSEKLHSFVDTTPFVTRENTSGEKFCFETAQSFLSNLVAVVNYGVLLTDRIKDQLVDVKKNVKQALMEQIDSSRWVTNKERLKMKISNVKFELFYPKILNDKKTIDKIYKNLVLIHNLHFDNVVSIREYERRIMLSRKWYDSFWPVTPFVVNSWYSYIENKVYVPAGLILKLKVDKSNDLVYLYSTFGYIFAHHLGHAIDTWGSKFDEKGKLGEVFFTTREKYDSKKKAVELKYDDLCPFPKLCINGNQTLDSNIATNVGIRTSYKALKKAKGSLSEDEEKNFFKGFAKMYCTPKDKSFVEWIIKGYDACPNEQRVNGALKILSEFSDLYYCSYRSEMGSHLSKIDIFY